MKVLENTLYLSQQEWLDQIACALDHLPLNCALEEAVEDALWGLRNVFGQHISVDIPSIDKHEADKFYVWLQEAEVSFCGNEL